MKLTENFSLGEFTASNTATRLGFTEQFNPPDEVVDNLRELCVNVLQPIRDLLPDGSMRISSGYRCERLNENVKGAKTSQHLKGQAADVQYFENGVMNNRKLLSTIKGSGIEYDQLIDEYDLSWVHVSYDANGNRKQFLKVG